MKDRQRQAIDSKPELAAITAENRISKGNQFYRLVRPVEMVSRCVGGNFHWWSVNAELTSLPFANTARLRVFRLLNSRSCRFGKVVALW